MAWPEYAVPLTLHDLPARETYNHMICSLKALEDASNGVFTRIEEAAQSRRVTVSLMACAPRRERLQASCQPSCAHL